MHKFLLNIYDSQWQQLLALSARTGKPVAELVRHALDMMYGEGFQVDEPAAEPEPDTDRRLWLYKKNPNGRKGKGVSDARENQPDTGTGDNAGAD